MIIRGPLTMTDTKPTRGRPKGTGIDDRIWLREMERLMRLDPGLRPTSAIKALGVTDPSAIRRLRDKYAAGERYLNADHSGAPRARRVRASVAAQAAATDPVKRQRPSPRFVSSASASSANSQPDVPPGPRPGADEPSAVLSQLWGQAFQNAALFAQWSAIAMTAWSRTPVGALWLGQHVAINDAIAAAIREQTQVLARHKR